MVADWIRLAGGMLTIRVRGAELERFLNLCAQQRIMLYRIRRTSSRIGFTASLSARSPAICSFCAAICTG